MLMRFRLTQLLEGREYCLSYEEFYSLRDLIEINKGTLLAKLERVMQAYESHITKECEVLLCCLMPADANNGS